jgi:serine protease Do
VLAVGSPLGVVGAVAVGVLHAAPRAADAWVRADVRLLPGNSGGPLADTSGRVIGINSMVVSGLGHAVPVAAVERFLRAPEARPRLGVRVRPVRVRRGADGEEMAGLMLLELEPEGAAARGGLLPGDVVVAAGGRALRLPGDLSGALYAAAPGDAVVLDVVRAGRLESHPVVLARDGPSDERVA